MNDVSRTKDQLIKELRTSRRKTASLEKKLKEKTDAPHWQSVFDSLNDAVCILDQNGVILRCNRASKTLFGKPLSKLIGKKCWGVVYGTSKIPVEGCSFNRMLETGQRESTEKQLKGRWFRITTDPIKDKDGQLLGAVYVLSDIARLKQMELSLYESQRLYARAEQIGNFGHWSRDYITDKAIWSAGMYRMFGIRPEEFGSDFDFFLRLVNPADIEHLRRSIDAAMTAHSPLDVEYRIRRPDGQERLIHSTAEILFGEDNRAVGLFGICQDITDQRRAEETLRESEKRFSTIFHFSPISIAITRIRDNQFVDVNEAWQEITGFSREEVIGHTPTALNLWIDAEERSRFIARLTDRGLVRGVEVLMRQKSGRKLNLLFSAGLITLAGERCMLSMALDITDRKEMERQVIEAHLFSQSTIDALTDHICVLDITGRILTVNRAWREFAQANPPTSPGYYVGANYLEVCDSAHGPNSAEAASFAAGLRAVMSGEQDTFSLEYPCNVPGGEERWFIARVTAFAEQAPRLTVVAHRNITDRKKAEDNLHRYRRRLSELSSKIALIAENERRRFADELHDLTGQNLALAKIKLSELRDVLPDKGVLNQVDELYQLIEEAAASTRALTFELSPPILYEIGFEAAAEWLGEQILRKYNISFHFDDDTRPKPLPDEAKVLLFVSLRELIVNIAKHSKAQNATVALHREGDMLHVSVTDDGIGFDASALDFQIMKATSFGLFSTRERVERLGGRLEIVSQPGKGLTVTMVVPLKK